MKRKITVTITLLCTGWLLYIAWRRLTALRWVGPTPQPTLAPAADVPDHAYADACRVARATELRANEFCWEYGELLWTHPIYKYFFVAVWKDNHWVLRQLLLAQTRKKVAVPTGMARMIGSFYGLAAEMQQKGLDPTKPAHL